MLNKKIYVFQLKLIMSVYYFYSFKLLQQSVKQQRISCLCTLAAKQSILSEKLKVAICTK